MSERIQFIFLHISCNQRNDKDGKPARSTRQNDSWFSTTQSIVICIIFAHENQLSFYIRSLIVNHSVKQRYNNVLYLYKHKKCLTSYVRVARFCDFSFLFYFLIWQPGNIQYQIFIVLVCGAFVLVVVSLFECTSDNKSILMTTDDNTVRFQLFLIFSPYFD